MRTYLQVKQEIQATEREKWAQTISPMVQLYSCRDNGVPYTNHGVEGFPPLDGSKGIKLVDMVKVDLDPDYFQVEITD